MEKRRTPRVDMAEERERLGYAISAAMTERGISGPKLATQLGKSPNTIHRWTTGETVMSALDVKPVAIALGVTYDLFIDPPKVPVYPIKDYLVEHQPRNPAGE